MITGAVTVKAIAVAENYEQSEVSSFTYGFADQVEAPEDQLRQRRAGDGHRRWNHRGPREPASITGQTARIRT